ncbi:hypothetical protein ABIB62_004643 [Mucilaginibacter sp. UYP25]
MTKSNKLPKRKLQKLAKFNVSTVNKGMYDTDTTTVTTSVITSTHIF